MINILFLEWIKWTIIYDKWVDIYYIFIYL